LFILFTQQNKKFQKIPQSVISISVLMMESIVDQWITIFRNLQKNRTYITMCKLMIKKQIQSSIWYCT